MPALTTWSSPPATRSPTVAAVVRRPAPPGGWDGCSWWTTARPTARRRRRRGPGPSCSPGPGLSRGARPGRSPWGSRPPRLAVLVFFDADILDARPDHFEALAAPVLAGEAWLSCGMISYGRLRDPFFLRLPPITGLRAIRREVFEAIPDSKRNGFQIEIMINEVIARRGLPSTIQVLPGCGTGPRSRRWAGGGASPRTSP